MTDVRGSHVNNMIFQDYPLQPGRSPFMPESLARKIGVKKTMKYEDHTITVLPLDELILSLNNELKEYNADILVLKDLASAGHSVVKQVSLIGVLGTAYVKTASDGKQYVIFKGYAGARPNLPGTTIRRWRFSP